MGWLTQPNSAVVWYPGAHFSQATIFSIKIIIESCWNEIITWKVFIEKILDKLIKSNPIQLNPLCRLWAREISISAGYRVCKIPLNASRELDLKVSLSLYIKLNKVLSKKASTSYSTTRNNSMIRDGIQVETCLWMIILTLHREFKDTQYASCHCVVSFVVGLGWVNIVVVGWVGIVVFLLIYSPWGEYIKSWHIEGHLA